MYIQFNYIQLQVKWNNAFLTWYTMTWNGTSVVLTPSPLLITTLSFSPTWSVPSRSPARSDTFRLLCQSLGAGSPLVFTASTSTPLLPHERTYRCPTSLGRSLGCFGTGGRGMTVLLVCTGKLWDISHLLVSWVSWLIVLGFLLGLVGSKCARVINPQKLILEAHVIILWMHHLRIVKAEAFKFQKSSWTLTYRKCYPLSGLNVRKRNCRSRVHVPCFLQKLLSLHLNIERVSRKPKPTIEVMLRIDNMRGDAQT